MEMLLEGNDGKDLYLILDFSTKRIFKFRLILKLKIIKISWIHLWLLEITAVESLSRELKI